MLALDAPEEVVYVRKQELVREELRRQRERYLDLTNHSPEAHVINAAQPLAQVVAESVRVASEIAQDFPRAIFFAGKLIFERERWFDRFLHNETAYAMQRRLQFAGLQMVVLPVRVLE